MSQRTLDAVREAQGAGVEPWNTAEHDKAVHNPAHEGGTTSSMESEPPESEACDDERDKSALVEDMAFIDDTSLELPDVAMEGEVEGRGSQSQYSQQSQEAESKGSQSSQGLRAADERPGRTNGTEGQFAQRFLDRLRLELLQGGGGGDGHRHAEDGNDVDEDGGRSKDEEMPDRTTEPGPSEQPPETGHPNDGAKRTTNLQ